MIKIFFIFRTVGGVACTRASRDLSPALRTTRRRTGYDTKARNNHRGRPSDLPSKIEDHRDGPRPIITSES